MKKILITRKLINSSEELATKVFDVKLNKEDKILTKEDLINESKGCDGILSFWFNLTSKFLLANSSLDFISFLVIKIFFINFLEL